MLKSLTLWEPWATLLAMGEKRIETRDWSTLYRGPVAIHAAKGGLTQSMLKAKCSQRYFSEALKEMLALATDRRHVPHFAFGHVIAVGTLSGCVRTNSYRCLPGVFDDYPDLDTPKERAFGNYGEWRFGFVFTNMCRLVTPVPFKSRQGKLIDLDAVAEAAVRSQLEATP